MTMIRPGGEALTKKAVRLANIQKGARVLDVGCGEGDTAFILKEEFGFDVTGIDASSKLIEKGRQRHENLDLRCMEAEFLEFESKTFDAIFMECSLSVFRLQEDALFEAYCLLKPDGKLIISDLYHLNPDPARVAEMLAGAHEKASKPKTDNSCEENQKPSFIMLDGALVINELVRMTEDMGFEIDHFENVENALPDFTVQAIMGYGSLEEYFKAVVPEGSDPGAFFSCASLNDPKNLGYFLMVLKKPGP